MAMNGISREVESRLAASIEQTAASLESPGIAMMDEYQEANIVFHHTIMMECGNELIAHTYERIRHLPFAELGTLAFENANYERERTRLTVGFSQHVIILDAIRRRNAQLFGSLREARLIPQQLSDPIIDRHLPRHAAAALWSGHQAAPANNEPE